MDPGVTVSAWMRACNLLIFRQRARVFPPRYGGRPPFHDQPAPVLVDVLVDLEPGKTDWTLRIAILAAALKWRGFE